MAKVASLWIGKELGVLERACINAFLKIGDDFVLYVYDKVLNVPDGVEIEDARSILDTKNIVIHKQTGSPALHSDLFRYSLIAKTDLIWVDLDILPLRSFDFDREYIFGFESDSFINGAVLRMPKDSLALKELLSFNEKTKGFPVNIDLFSFETAKFLFRVLLYKRLDITVWPWGSIGPKAITSALRRTGEEIYALPKESFYPISFENLEDLLLPGLVTKDMFNEKCYAIHLWGKELRNIIDNKYNGFPPKGSFLYDYCD